MLNVQFIGSDYFDNPNFGDVVVQHKKLYSFLFTYNNKEIQQIQNINNFTKQINK